jgi:hypothetical protein
MAQCISWLKRNGMKGCHMLVDSETSRVKAKHEEWLAFLQTEGMTGYLISDLNKLPSMLEGANSYGSSA